MRNAEAEWPCNAATGSKAVGYGVRTRTQLELSGWLVQLLTPLQTAATALHQLIQVQTVQIENQSTRPPPKGLATSIATKPARRSASSRKPSDSSLTMPTPANTWLSCSPSRPIP